MTKEEDRGELEARDPVSCLSRMKKEEADFCTASTAVSSFHSPRLHFKSLPSVQKEKKKMERVNKKTRQREDLRERERERAGRKG